MVGEHARSRACARAPRPGRRRARGRRSARRRGAGSGTSSRWLPCRTQPLDPRALGGDRVGGRPARRGAASRRPAGSSRSGSGVIDSHDARLTMGGRLTATDHKVRMEFDMASAPRHDVCRRTPSAAATPSSRALLPRPGAARGRAGADLRADLAARRPRLGAAAARAATSPARAGSQPVLVVRDDERRAARLPQRLPPPRLAPAERLGPVQGGDPLPLPRLDVPLRRQR